MERGSRSRESRPATGEEAVAAAGAGSDVVFGAAAAAGSSRPYHECGFCKHGFTSAQALGGHMNIHRRDHARRPGRDAPAGTASAAYRKTERYGQYRDMAYLPAPPVSGSDSMYYPGACADGDAVGAGSPSPRELNLFGAAAATHHDHDLHLGLGYHGRHGGPLMPEEMEPPAGEPERNLDLELKLGRHPSWQ